MNRPAWMVRFRKWRTTTIMTYWFWAFDKAEAESEKHGKDTLEFKSVSGMGKRT
jgi:hypothetical protein